MSKKYYWQHEDTGRVCATASSLRPSHRWYKISAKAYRAHEAHLTKYAPDVASAASAEHLSSVEIVAAVEFDTQPRG